MSRRLPRRSFLRGIVAAPAAGVAAGAAAGAASCTADPGDHATTMEDFAGTALPGTWRAYDGAPSSDPHVRWDPRLVRVADSRLILSATPGGGGWHAGAVSNWPQPRQYGTWEVRLRAHPHPVLSYHVLLWPRDERWPPEIDLIEGFRADRRRGDAFIHWRDGAGRRRKRQFQVQADFTRDRTVRVDWGPESVVLSCDGAEFGRVTGPAVPQGEMWLAIQVEAQATADGAATPEGNGRTASGAPDYGAAVDVLEVDWVRSTPWTRR